MSTNLTDILKFKIRDLQHLTTALNDELSKHFKCKIGIPQKLYFVKSRFNIFGHKMSQYIFYVKHKHAFKICWKPASGVCMVEILSHRRKSLAGLEKIKNLSPFQASLTEFLQHILLFKNNNHLPQSKPLVLSKEKAIFHKINIMIKK